MLFENRPFFFGRSARKASFVYPQPSLLLQMKFLHTFSWNKDTITSSEYLRTLFYWLFLESTEILSHSLKIYPIQNKGLFLRKWNLYFQLSVHFYVELQWFNLDNWLAIKNYLQSHKKYHEQNSPSRLYLRFWRLLKTANFIAS